MDRKGRREGRRRGKEMGGERRRHLRPYQTVTVNTLYKQKYCNNRHDRNQYINKFSNIFTFLLEMGRNHIHLLMRN